jgi:hypothetical protein
LKAIAGLISSVAGAAKLLVKKIRLLEVNFGVVAQSQRSLVEYPQLQPGRRQQGFSISSNQTSARSELAG